MFKQSSKSNKKQKRDDKSESEDSDDDLQPIHFFVPGENINAAVLVEYINQYVDNTAKIISSHNPTDKTRTGFTVTAKKTLNAVSLRDLINDSRDWELETQSKTFRKGPYRYAESVTAKRRAQQGASKGGTTRPPRPPREQRETTAEAVESFRRDKGSSTSMSPAPAQYGQYHQPSQPHEYQRSTSGYYQSTSRPDQGPNTYYTSISNTVNTTSYNANLPTNPSQHNTNPYSTGGYQQMPKRESDYPPPPYQLAGPPQRPEQPGPDTFDREDKPRISQTMDVSGSRQGSIAPGDEASRSHSSQARRPSNYEEMMRRQGHSR